MTPSTPRPEVNKWVITVSITFGTLMGAIDSSIVNVAIPHMRGSLGASVDEITWVSTGYIIANVLVMPVVAWLGRRYGRKNVYQSCMLLFLVGSFFCGTARSLNALVFFRIIQGLGAGGLQPTEQAILRETFPLEEQAMAMSLFGLAVMIGPALGPTLGGWIVDHYSWPWIFFVNLPIGAVGLYLVQRNVHDPDYLVFARDEARRQSVDYVGLMLLSLGLGCLQLMLERGDTEDWWSSHFIVGLTVVSAFSLVAFVIRELTTPYPIVDLSVLKYRSYSAGTFIGAVLGLSLFGSLFMLPLFFQELRGLSATQSGIELMPRTLVMVMGMPIAGALFNRVGARPMIAVGLLIGGYASWMMSRFTIESSLSGMVMPQIVQGLGFSLVFVALSTTTLARIPKESMSAATGLYNLIRNLGGSVGTTVIAVLFERSQVLARSSLIGDVAANNPLAQARLHGARGVLAARHGFASVADGLRLLDGMVMQQATVIAFERVFFIIGLIFMVSVPLVVLLDNVRPGRGRKAEAVAVE